MPESIKRFFRPGGIANLALGAIALVVFLAVGVASIPKLGGSGGGVPEVSVPPTPHEVAVALTRAGLDAASLTAAGLASNQITAMVAEAHEHLLENMDDLRLADEAWASARREADRLEALIRAGGGNGEDVQALAAARATLENESSARDGALAGLFSAATDELGQGPVGLLTTMRQNREAGWDLPVEYLTLTRTQAQWVALRDALANVRISANLGEEPDGECATLVAGASAEGSVASAKTSLDAHLATNAAAWQSAING